MSEVAVAAVLGGGDVAGRCRGEVAGCGTCNDCGSQVGHEGLATSPGTTWAPPGPLIPGLAPTFPGLQHPTGKST
eukprot:135345-Chlamydomonas_euryale.AAC.4